jgi:predicted cobalt transporter CbtA
MTRTYLVRGMLVGLLASIAAFGFAKTMGEPQIAKAETFEAQQAHLHGDPEDDPVVSRAVQDTVGLGAGLVVAGAALGGIFSLAFAFVYRRFTQRSARATSALLGAGAFMALYVVPFLKYPANPPAIGNPDTIGKRTVLYFLLLAMAALAMVLAAIVRSRLRPRLGAWNAAIAAVALFCAVIGVVYVVMPGINEVPAGFPIIVLWRFRVASLGIQLLLWTGIGLGFGALTERAELRAAPRRVAQPVGV